MATPFPSHAPAPVSRLLAAIFVCIYFLVRIFFPSLHTDSRRQSSSAMATHAATKVPARFATTQNKGFPTDLLLPFSNLVQVQPTPTLTIMMPTAMGSVTLASSIAVWVPNAQLQHGNTASESCPIDSRGTSGSVGRSTHEGLQRSETLHLTRSGIDYLTFFVHICG